jgi:ribonuclease VapC
VSQVVVLDASAVLAFLQGEPGSEMVLRCLQAQPCCVTAANQAEIVAKALDRGVALEVIQTILSDLAYTVIDIKAEDGQQAGQLRTQTRAAGLSLGDRLCLATAQRLKARVITADRPWLAMARPLGLDIHCIRPDAH